MSRRPRSRFGPGPGTEAVKRNKKRVQAQRTAWRKALTERRRLGIEVGDLARRIHKRMSGKVADYVWIAPRGMRAVRKPVQSDLENRMIELSERIGRA